MKRLFSILWLLVAASLAASLTASLAAEEIPAEPEESASEAAAEPDVAPGSEQDSKAAADAALEARVREILDTPMEEAVKPERCLSVHAYRRVEILDNQRLVFHGRGGDAWLNQLARPCVGLRPDYTLTFEIRHNSVCAMDTFRAVSSAMGAMTPLGPTCFLSDFEPITEAQVTLLKEALKQRRDSERQRRKAEKAEKAETKADS